jgi:hypothetical protein
LRAAILEDALTAGVSAFDALGKTLRVRHPGILPARPKNLFQNLEALDKALEKASGSAPSALLSADDFAFLLRMFQVRHICEHNAGVMDTDFCQKIPGMQHLQGRKYRLERAEVDHFLSLLPALADAVSARLPDPPLPA